MSKKVSQEVQDWIDRTIEEDKIGIWSHSNQKDHIITIGANFAKKLKIELEQKAMKDLNNYIGAIINSETNN